MLRDKNLIPLSHQHQRALALCVRIDRAQPIPEKNLPMWQLEIEQQFQKEIEIHFAAEEEIVFPAARKFSELIPLVDELLSEHAMLRNSSAQAKARVMTNASLATFAQQLSAHIRKEERQLFERLQELLTQEELASIGKRLDTTLKEATDSCLLPNEATKLQSTKK
jgi:hemerythrin-like domain-containing protein